MMRLGSTTLALAMVAGAIPATLILAGPAQAQTSAAPHMSATRYDIARRVTGTIAPDPDGAGPLGHPAVRNVYDARGRLIRVDAGVLASWQADTVAPDNWTGFTVFRSVEHSYDEMGRKLRDTVRVGSTIEQITQYSYNAMGELDCTAVRMNPASFASLPASACTLSSPAAGGSFGPDRITRNVYDAATGRLVQVRKAVGTSLEQAYVSYTHTANGQVATVTDANGGTARYTYDGHDRLRRWHFPMPGTAGVANDADYEEYAYDNSSNRISLRKRDCRVITYSYDALSRNTARIIPDGAPVGTGCDAQSIALPANATRDVHYRYDNRGLQRSVRFDSATGADGLTITYDNAGRQLTSALAMGGVSWQLAYQWNRNGLRTRVTHPDGNFFTYAADGLGRIVEVRENGATILANYRFNNRGELDCVGRVAVADCASPGGAQPLTDIGYDGLSRPTSHVHNLAGTSGDLTTGFSYNPANQITQRTRGNTAYIYGGDVNVARTYAVNGLNQYVAAVSNGVTTSFQHDRNGNLVSDGAVSFVYDAENRLIAASGAANATLAYDPMGRLYETAGGTAGVTRFLYDGDELVAEYNASGVLLRRYVHGAAVDDPLVVYEGAGVSAANRRHLFADHQGSIISLSDASGALLAINRYDDWGTPDATNLGRFQFTGQAWIPELGLYHYKARIYSPTLGRFLQTDPIGYEDQQNLYAYVGNDPVNARDPTGMYECKDETACNLAARAREQMTRAQNHYSREARRSGTTLSQQHSNRVAARAIGHALTALGTRGDGNGLNVETATLNTDYEARKITVAQYDRSNSTISIDPTALATRSNVSVGAVFAHEIYHHRLRNQTFRGDLAPEVRPLMATFVVERGLGGLRNETMSNWVQDQLISYCHIDGLLCRRGVENAYANESRRPF